MSLSNPQIAILRAFKAGQALPDTITIEEIEAALQEASKRLGEGTILRIEGWGVNLTQSDPFTNLSFSFGNVSNPAFRNPTTMRKHNAAKKIAGILLEANGLS